MDKDVEINYILAEYKAIRDEINNLNVLVINILNLSILVFLAVMGYIIQLKDLDYPLLFLPFLTIFPALFIIISRFQAIMRISGYIRVFLEKEGGLSYEKRYLRWIAKVKDSKKRIGYSFRETVLYLYIGLGLISILVFIWKGIVPDFNDWKSIIFHILYYSWPSYFYWKAYNLIKTDWRKIYDEYWKKVKEEMNN